MHQKTEIPHISSEDKDIYRSAPEFGIYLVYDKNGGEKSNMSFIAYRIREEPFDVKDLETLCFGFLKWDGCINLMFESDYHHFCGQSEMNECFEELTSSIYFAGKLAKLSHLTT